MNGSAKRRHSAMSLGCRKAWNLGRDYPGVSIVLGNIVMCERNQPRRATYYTVPLTGKARNGRTDGHGAGERLSGPGRGYWSGCLTVWSGVALGAVRKFWKWMAAMVAHTTNWLWCKLTACVLYYHKNDDNCSKNIPFVSLVSSASETGHSIV